jgi:hypothetical protein
MALQTGLGEPLSAGIRRPERGYIDSSYFKERDWNTVVDEDGTRDYAVEELLARRIDGPAAPVFEALRRDEFPLAQKARWALARFVAAQLAPLGRPNLHGRVIFSGRDRGARPSHACMARGRAPC